MSRTKAYTISLLTRSLTEQVKGELPGIPVSYLTFPLLGVVVVVAAVGSGLSMMHQHDIMQEPQYW